MTSPRDRMPPDEDDPLGLTLPPSQADLDWLAHLELVAKQFQAPLAATPLWERRLRENPERWRYETGGQVRLSRQRDTSADQGAKE
jgi:hypothetical protein